MLSLRWEGILLGWDGIGIAILGATVGALDPELATTVLAHVAPGLVDDLLLGGAYEVDAASAVGDCLVAFEFVTTNRKILCHGVLLVRL